MSDYEMWKLRKLIKSLQKTQGNATSLISVVISPGSQMSQTISMLSNELGTAENIKSRVNKLSVLSAITSVIQKLKLYPRVPKNGLVVYCGNIVTEDGKDKKVIHDIEPFKPINTSMYKCDSVFHTEVLSYLLEDNKTYGIVVMDGHGTMFARLNGNTKTIIHKFDVDLPKKHGRGGQSAVRFGRLRVEKRHNYVRKVTEEAKRLFITGDVVNVSGLILAGLAEFKEVLSDSPLFDPRLRSAVVNIVDVAYGGENGLNQAIDLSREVLSGVKLIDEKKVINNFFTTVQSNSDLVCYGTNDTMISLDSSNIKQLIIHDESTLPSPEEGYDTLVEYFVEKYGLSSIDSPVELHLVSDKTAEGAQFINGFGGIGGILRYATQLDHTLENNDDIVYDMEDYV